MTEAIVAALEQREKLRAYFPKTVAPKQMEDAILSGLELWKRKQARTKDKER